MNPTIRDVANRAGVSVSTASRVLSGSSHPVTPEVRKRVLDAAEELQFTPNSYARGLSKRDFRIIGLLIHDARDPYFVEITRGIEDLASEHGYLVVLCNTDRNPAKERKYVEELRGMRAGIIFTGGAIQGEAHLADLVNHPAPVVVIGRHPLPFASIQVDNVHGAFDATCHLIDIGRRQIAFINGPLSSATAVDRLEGYRRAMESRGLPVDDRLVIESDFSISGGESGLQQLRETGIAFDAVFGGNDQVAIGVLKEAKRCNMRVPEDLAIIGFNGITFTTHLDPPLSTLQLPLHRMGQLAAELLSRQIRAGRKESSSIVVRGEVVARGSTIGDKVDADPR